MWAVSNGYDLQMTEGDYGIDLPITLTGSNFSSGDVAEFVIKSAVNGTTKVTKTITSVENDVININLDSTDTAALPVGTYVYGLDWYRSGEFMCNIIPYATFKVVEKA